MPSFDAEVSASSSSPFSASVAGGGAFGHRHGSYLDNASPEAARFNRPLGIAYDPSRGRLFVTGKCWPRLFEIDVNNCEYSN